MFSFGLHPAGQISINMEAPANVIVKGCGNRIVEGGMVSHAVEKGTASRGAECVRQDHLFVCRSLAYLM